MLFRAANTTHRDAGTLAAPVPPVPPLQLWEKVGISIKDALVYSLAAFALKTVFRWLLFGHSLWRETWGVSGEVHIDWSSVIYVDENERDMDYFFPRAVRLLIVAPLTETWIFVFSWKVGSWLRLNQDVQVILIAVIFGALHITARMHGYIFFSGFISVSSFIGGMFMAAVYAKERVRFGMPYAFLACALCHYLGNLLAFEINFIAVLIGRLRDVL